MAGWQAGEAQGMMRRICAFDGGSQSPHLRLFLAIERTHIDRASSASFRLPIRGYAELRLRLLPERGAAGWNLPMLKAASASSPLVILPSPLKSSHLFNE